MRELEKERESAITYKRVWRRCSERESEKGELILKLKARNVEFKKERGEREMGEKYRHLIGLYFKTFQQRNLIGSYLPMQTNSLKIKY